MDGTRYAICLFICLFMFIYLFICIYIHSLLADPPDIDEGPFIPQPPFVRPGDMTVRINTPAYIVDGFILTLVCRLVSGTRPITIMWFRNGHPYPAGGHNSRITVSDYEDDEIFTCRAVNIVGFDMENTTVNGKYFLLNKVDIES